MNNVINDQTLSNLVKIVFDITLQVFINCCYALKKFQRLTTQKSPKLTCKILNGQLQSSVPRSFSAILVSKFKLRYAESKIEKTSENWTKDFCSIVGQTFVLLLVKRQYSFGTPGTFFIALYLAGSKKRGNWSRNVIKMAAEIWSWLLVGRAPCLLKRYYCNWVARYKSIY